MAGRGRRETFRQTMRDCQRQRLRVRQLVLQGSSLEQRDVAVSQAVAHSQWWLVSQLVQLGVSPKCRDLAVNKAVRYCLWDLAQELLSAGVSHEEGRNISATEATDQWELVFSALYLGVGQQQLSKVLREVGYPEHWELVPSLVTICNSHDCTEFVLHAAVRCSQWNCVQQLIKTSSLSLGQQIFVCRESLQWVHFECALELLRQGCDQGCAERIVLETLRWNRCQDLIDLLTEDGLRPGVRKAILNIAKEHVCWDDYLAIVKGAGATEKDMVDIVTTVLHAINVGFILRLFSVFTSARRVFKQVLLQTRFSDNAIANLHTYLVNDHTDLAFYMFVAQEMWECVMGMLGDARLSPKDKRFALRHAIRKCAWKAVRKMVRSRSTHQSECRYAFLQAARRGKWRLSLKLSTYSKRISLRDKVFALRFWLKHGLWNCLQDVHEKWVGHLEDGLRQDPDNKRKFMECILEESVIAEKLEVFTDACDKIDSGQTYYNCVFHTAMRHDKCNFIVEFCRHQKYKDEFKVAVELAVQKKKWSLLKELIEKTYDCVDDDWDPEEDFELNLLHLYLRGISKEEDAWQIVVPALNDFCDNFTTNEVLYWDPDNDFNDDCSEHNVQKLAAWCLEKSFGNAGLVLSVMSGSAENAARVTDEQNDKVSRDVLMFCFILALKMFDMESASTCLQHLSISEARSILHDLDGVIELDELVETCRENAQYKIVVYLGVFMKDWEQVTTALALCEETTVIDFVIKNALHEGEWDIVQSQLARCSQDASLLCTVFGRAIEAGQRDICIALISTKKIVQASVSIQSLLFKAVTSTGDREEMLKFCIKIGFSTHVKTCICTSENGCSLCQDSPMKTALNNGQLPLVKLLYKAGACSNKHLFCCKENNHLRNQLQSQGRHDIVEYLDRAATTPRTLQDLCRLQVSHHIGCHPGRLDRVMVLDIPWPVKDLINFEDVLS